MTTAQITIAGRPIGPGAPCYLIAEIGLGHDGSLGTAQAMIDVAAEAGADAVKFQTHLAAHESTPREGFRVRVFPQDATRFDYWQRTAFTPGEWCGLAERATGRGLHFLSSAFCDQAVDLLAPLVPAWKVASGEVGTLPLLERMAASGLPVLLSSGMSPWAELDAAVAAVRALGAPVMVFQCTTAYPCPPERLGLNLLAEMRSRYDCPVGLSDHSGRGCAGVAAAALGADAIEVHLCLHRRAFGPDVPASLTPEELANLAADLRFVHAATSHPLDKDASAAGFADLRSLFTKSVVAARDLAAGTVLARHDLALKKPGGGLPASALGSLVGQTLARALAADDALGQEDLA